MRAKFFSHYLYHIMRSALLLANKQFWFYEKNPLNNVKIDEISESENSVVEWDMFKNVFFLFICSQYVQNSKLTA
jgi:hypothetical protein